MRLPTLLVALLGIPFALAGYNELEDRAVGVADFPFHHVDHAVTGKLLELL